jgi:hypothetical protein
MTPFQVLKHLQKRRDRNNVLLARLVRPGLARKPDTGRP